MKKMLSLIGIAIISGIIITGCCSHKHEGPHGPHRPEMYRQGPPPRFDNKPGKHQGNSHRENMNRIGMPEPVKK